MRRTISIFALFIVACTFPDPAISNDAGKDGGGGDTGGDTTVADGAIDDTAPEPDTFEEIGDDANPCDHDNDGFKSGIGACTDPTPDCNDFTAEANPNQKGFVHKDPLAVAVKDHWTGTPGDWNCDGTVDKEYAQELCTEALTSGCTTRVGTKEDPTTVPCGHSATKNTCAQDTLGCKVGSASAYNMGCK